MKIKQSVVVTVVISLLSIPAGAQHTVKRKPITQVSSTTIQFVFTSDVHFGLMKENFRNKKNIASVLVNAAMIKQMNRLPGMVFPDDAAVNAGRKIKNIDAVIITGDIANREEQGIQSASASWNEFMHDYGGLLHLKAAGNKPAQLLLTPGNHDVSNAIGFYRAMIPQKDPAAMVGMYNLEIHPHLKMDAGHYNYQNDKLHYAVNIGGLHFVFINVWPDSAERAWLTKDLEKLSDNTTVLLFTHSMPDVEARFFTNPNGQHDINSVDKFENLVAENFKDGNAVSDSTLPEQRALVGFLKSHTNIKAWFHGHSNYTEYYDWKGPDKNIALHCFRADSPMKGKYSAKDETKLAFEVVSINTVTKELTARECLWNTDPSNLEKMPEWGSSISVSLK